MTRWTALVAFVICLVPRLVVLWLSPPVEPTFYWMYSTELLQHGILGQFGVRDTVIEPLYPAFLAVARKLTYDNTNLVLAIQIIVGSMGGVLLHRIAYGLTASAGAAWIATFLYAFDPYLVRQSVGLMEVTFFTAVLIGCAYGERRGGVFGSLFAGLATGAAVLVRFAVIPLAVLVPLLLARRSWKHGAIAALVTAMVIVPWMIRNQRVDGHITPSRVAVNLAVSMSDAAEQLLPVHNNDRLVTLIEEKTDAELLAVAFDFAKAHPWRTVKMKARNFLHVFNPRLLPYDDEPASARLRVEGGRYWIEGGTPRSPESQWIHGLWRTALLILAVVGLAIRGFRRDDAVLWAIVLTITAVCTVFYPTTRLTTPMMFALMVWAAQGLRGATVTEPAERSVEGEVPMQQANVQQEV